MNSKISKVSQTQVIRISDLPETLNVQSSAYFIVAQNGITNKLAFKTIQNDFKYYIGSKYDNKIESIENNLNVVNNKVINVSDHLEYDIGTLSCYTFTQLPQQISQLSSELNNIILDKEEKTNVQIMTINNTISNYNVPELRYQLAVLSTELKNLDQHEQTDIANLLTYTNEVTCNLDKRITTTDTKINRFRDNILKKAFPAIKGTIHELSTNFEAEKTSNDTKHCEITKSLKVIDECIDKLNSNINSLDSNIQTINRSLLQKIQDTNNQLIETINNKIALVISTLDSTSKNLSSYSMYLYDLSNKKLQEHIRTFNDMSYVLSSAIANEDLNVAKISAYIKEYDNKIISSNVDMLSINVDKFSNQLDELDIRLYGLIEQSNVNGIVSDNVLIDGDIHRLSVSITDLSNDVKNIEKIVNDTIGNMTVIKDFDNGTFHIEGNQNKVLILEIQYDKENFNYFPIQLVNIEFHDTDINAIEIMNKYIVNRKYARLEIRNNTSTAQTFKLTTSVIYQNLKQIQ